MTTAFLTSLREVERHWPTIFTVDLQASSVAAAAGCLVFGEKGMLLEVPPLVNIVKKSLSRLCIDLELVESKIAFVAVELALAGSLSVITAVAFGVLFPVGTSLVAAGGTALFLATSLETLITFGFAATDEEAGKVVKPERSIPGLEEARLVHKEDIGSDFEKFLTTVVEEATQELTEPTDQAWSAVQEKLRKVIPCKTYQREHHGEMVVRSSEEELEIVLKNISENRKIFGISQDDSVRRAWYAEVKAHIASAVRELERKIKAFPEEADDFRATLEQGTLKLAECAVVCGGGLKDEAYSFYLAAHGNFFEVERAQGFAPSVEKWLVQYRERILQHILRTYSYNPVDYFDMRSGMVPLAYQPHFKHYLITGLLQLGVRFSSQLMASYDPFDKEMESVKRQLGDAKFRVFDSYFSHFTPAAIAEYVHGMLKEDPKQFGIAAEELLVWMKENASPGQKKALADIEQKWSEKTKKKKHLVKAELEKLFAAAKQNKPLVTTELEKLLARDVLGKVLEAVEQKKPKPEKLIAQIQNEVSLGKMCAGEKDELLNDALFVRGYTTENGMPTAVGVQFLLEKHGFFLW